MRIEIMDKVNNCAENSVETDEKIEQIIQLLQIPEFDRNKGNTEDTEHSGKNPTSTPKNLVHLNLPVELNIKFRTFTELKYLSEFENMEPGELLSFLIQHCNYRIMELKPKGIERIDVDTFISRMLHDYVQLKRYHPYVLYGSKTREKMGHPEKETGENELPMKWEVAIKIGRLSINRLYWNHTPRLEVEFGSDPEAEERAGALRIEHPLLVMGPIDVIQSFFIKHLVPDGDGKREPFSKDNYSLAEGQSPFIGSADENGIRYLKPINDRIFNLPDECGNEWENKFMKWFKFWSLAAIQKYGEDACIQFWDYECTE